MKVALIGRTSMHKVKGGDTVQLVNTAAELERAGVAAHVYLASEKVPYESYDLLHFFNLIRPADHLYHINKSRKPYVISTIYLDYSLFDQHREKKLHRHLFRYLGKARSEYIKNMYRYITRQDKLVSKRYLLGHKRSLREVMNGAGMLLPNSLSEHQRLRKDFGDGYRVCIIPNGINRDIFGKIPTDIKREKKVICVAQVYGMKNQHLLIQACNEAGYPLDIIGRPPPNHLAYYDHCRNIAGPGVRFFDLMPQEELVRHYASAEVHALPSWFETTGLSSLEAAAMGCKVVAGNIGDASDYLWEDAWYCDPSSLISLKKALNGAMEANYDDSLRQRILNDYTWEKAAQKTLEAYMKCLGHE